jgi:hypothetical protein
MFFGYPVERLCTYQYSLISLVPDLLLSLEDAGSPSMDRQSSKRKRAESLKTSDRKSLLQFMGLPLHLFGQDSFFQPYLPLQQIDMATKSKSFLVGTTNSIFRQQKECAIDVIVDLEHSSLEYLDPRLQQVVNLTAEDRKWMDEIVNVVVDTWNAADPSRPSSMQYIGSDDYLRSKFEEYICSMLSSIKYSDYQAQNQASFHNILLNPDTHTPTAPTTDSFGPEFIAAFKTTRAFALWNKTTDSMIFDLFDYKHPCEGKTSTLEDVSLRLTSGIYDLHLDEHLAKNLGPTKERLGNALNTGGQTAWKMANKWGQDLAKYRRDQIAKQQQQQSSDTAAPHSPTKGVYHVSSSPSSEQPTNGTTAASYQATVSDLQKQAQAAALQAGTQVRSALGSFGSFLSSKQKQWAGGAAAAPTTSTTTEDEKKHTDTGPTT